MSFTIDFDEVKTSVLYALNTAQAEGSKWLDRAVIVLKAGRDMALPLLQDKQVAMVALVVSNLVLFKIVSKLSQCFSELALRKGSDSLANKGKVILDWTASGALAVVGVVATARFLSLPLTFVEIAGCSAVSAAVYSLIY